MTIEICETSNFSQYHASLTYDIQTQAQATLFLIYASIYFIGEVIFGYLTCRLLHSLKAGINLYVIAYYACFNLSLTSGGLYFTGGIICYNIILYNIFADFSYLYQSISVFALLHIMLEASMAMEFANTGQKSTDQEKTLSPLPWSVMIAIYISGFMGLFFYELIVEEKLHFFYLYNFLCHTFLALFFLILSRDIMAALSEKYPSINNSLGTVIRGITVLMVMLMLSRGTLAGLNYLGATYSLKENYLAAFTLMIIAFCMIFDLLPCVALGLLIYKVQIEGKNDSEVLSNNQRQTELRQTIMEYGKKKKSAVYHSPSTKSYHEEFVDSEGEIW